MLVCKACWDVYDNVVAENTVLDICPKPKCMGNKLDDIDEAFLPTIMTLHLKGYFAEHCSSCHFYDFGTALTPTCFIVFGEQVRLLELPEAPQGFNYESFGDGKITMRKTYKAASQLDLHEEILSTSLDLLRWARSIGALSKREDEENPPWWVVDKLRGEEDERL
jgi:hypothetical protein